MKTHKEKYRGGLKIIQGRIKSKNINSRVFYIVLFSLLFLLTIMYLMNRDKDIRLKKNGVITKAVIKKVVHNSYIMNELDVTGPNNYHFTYIFKVKKDSLEGLYEILYENYSDYFRRTMKKNDTVTIIYDRENPFNNKIVKLTSKN